MKPKGWLNDIFSRKEYVTSLDMTQGIPSVGLHVTMFSMCIESFSDEEQYKLLWPKVKNFEILGTYSQTELGHGSYV